MSYTLHIESERTWNNGDTGGSVSNWIEIDTYACRDDAVRGMYEQIGQDSVNAIVIEDSTDRVVAAWEIS